MPLRPLSPRPTLVTLALWAAATAQAQTDATTLPAVRASAATETESATGPVNGYNARRSSTATKTDTPLDEVPQSISVISAEQVKDQNAQTLQEVLRYTAGVRSDLYGLDNRGDWFALRGGSQGSTLLDGLRLPLSGWWGVVRNEPHAFERIEVLRGPASVMAGQNGPGGVVNLVSKRPLAEARREVSVQLGNDDHRQIATDLTGPLNDDASLQYRFLALKRDRDTQVEHAFDKRELVAPSLRWQPRPGTALTVYAEYQHDKSGNTQGFFPVAGTLRPGPDGYIPLDTFVGEPGWDTYGGTRKRLGYEVEHAISQRWTVRQRLRHDRVDGRLRTMYAAWWEGYRNAQGEPDPQGRYLNRIWYANEDRHRVLNADLLLEGRLDAGRLQHTVLAGVDAMSSRSVHRDVEAYATPLDVYDPSYGSFDLPALDYGPGTHTRARKFGVFVQDQVKLDGRWVGVASLRRDRARTRTDEAEPEKDSATTKNLGLVYLADGGWSPYLGYSESFEPVSGTDAQGRPFHPSRGKQLEAGVKWAPDARWSATAALYKLKEDGRTTPDPAAANFLVQTGEVTVEGVELEVKGDWAAWQLVGNLTYTDARKSKVSAAEERYRDKQLESIPKHSAAAWVLHRLAALPGFKAGLGVRYAGRSSDGTDTLDTPSYTLFDALLGFDRGPWSFAFNLTNLTDKRYIVTCLERGDCWYGTKRRAVATLDYRW